MFRSSDVKRMDSKLDCVIRLLHSVLEKEKVMAKELDDLTTQVKANTDAEAAAIALLNGLASQIADLAAKGGTPAQFAALAATLKGSADALGAAVVANTPAAPAAAKK